AAGSPPPGSGWATRSRRRRPRRAGPDPAGGRQKSSSQLKIDGQGLRGGAALGSLGSAVTNYASGPYLLGSRDFRPRLGTQFMSATSSDRIDAYVWRISAVVILGSIMSILDTTIVNVALDTLSHDLHSSIAQIQWVVTGYMLALAAVIPVTGW